MASTRLPGKPLADIAGVPMIVHVLRRAEEAGIGRGRRSRPIRPRSPTRSRPHGGEAVMTRADHPSGSDRIFEALEQARSRSGDIDIVVNVQGDLPTIAPDDIRAVLAPLADPAVDIATLAPRSHARRSTPIRTW